MPVVLLNSKEGRVETFCVNGLQTGVFNVVLHGSLTSLVLLGGILCNDFWVVSSQFSCS